MKTIYTASAWWSDCEAFVGIIGTDPQKVEEAIHHAMHEEAKDAWDTAEPEDPRTIGFYLDEIFWSGVHIVKPDELDSLYDEDFSKVSAGDDNAISYWRGF